MYLLLKLWHHYEHIGSCVESWLQNIRVPHLRLNEQQPLKSHKNRSAFLCDCLIFYFLLKLHQINGYFFIIILCHLLMSHSVLLWIMQSKVLSVHLSWFPTVNVCSVCYFQEKKETAWVLSWTQGTESWQVKERSRVMDRLTGRGHG